MPRLAVSIRLRAGVEQVHRMVLDPPGPLLPEGGPLFRRLSGRGEPGSVYRFQFRRLGLRFRADAAVTDLTPSRIAFQGQSGWRMDALVELEPVGPETQLRFQMRYRFQWPLRWLVPGPLVRLGVWHAITRFQQMVEAAPSGAHPVEAEGEFL